MGVGSLEDLVGFASDLEIDGQPAIEDTQVREQIADYVTKARGLKNTSLRTLTALSKGLPPGPEASMGKLVGAVLQQEAASFAMDLAGASGALLDPEATPDAAAWQERYLSLPGLRIAGGTDEILRNIIAERVMGLPSDARADKGVASRFGQHGRPCGGGIRHCAHAAPYSSPGKLRTHAGSAAPAPGKRQPAHFFYQRCERALAG